MKFIMIFCFLFFTMAHIFALKEPIVIIGGGLAGLTTAYRLQQQGFQPHVYEARNRIGGRIFSVTINQHIGELGGQNILDGKPAENLCHLIRELQLELISSKMNLSFQYLIDGRLVPERTLLSKMPWSSDDLKSQLEAAAKKSHNMYEVLRETVGENTTLFNILKVKLAGYEGAGIENLSTIYIETLYYMLLGGLSATHQCGNEEVKSLDHLSLKGGNSLLIDKLAQTIGNRLHLNMPLKAISKTQHHSYVLHFQNGQVIEAEKIILAIPCSVYNDINIQKDVIPEERLSNIKKIKYGTNSKILVPLNSLSSNSGQLLNERAIAFFNADHQIVNLYYTGETGRFSTHNLAEIYQQDLSLLEAGFGLSSLPNSFPVLAKDEFFVSYSTPVGHSWPNDPYAKGSYSYISPGQEALFTETIKIEGEIVKSLFAPVENTLYFAGEHASILIQAAGTMEAACESGERTARMILKSLQE